MSIFDVPQQQAVRFNRSYKVFLQHFWPEFFVRSFCGFFLFFEKTE
jgi:hypothetical protein